MRIAHDFTQTPLVLWPCSSCATSSACGLPVSTRDIMAEFPALPLFTDAFIGDTTHLNAAQTGAYLMLMMIAWRLPECALPNDDEKLARWARMDNRTWKRQKSTVMEFWKLGDDARWRQGRLSDERHYVEVKSKSNSQAAKVRWLKNNNTDNANASTMQCERNAPTPTPTPISKNKKEYTSDFLKFWELYPRHDGSKSDAFKSYQRALKEGIDHERLIRSVEAFREYIGREGTAREYVAHATTWLNGKRWEADYSAEGTGRGAYARNVDKNGQPENAGGSNLPPSKWIAEGDRLAAKYRAEAQRKRQSPTSGDVG